MKLIRLLILLSFITVPISGFSLERLSDTSLSGVQGQSGLTIEQGQLLNIGELSYTDDGNSLEIEGLRFSSQNSISENANTTYILDVSNDGALRLQTEVKPTQMYISGIRINDSDASIGSLTLNYEGVTDFTLKGKATGGLEGSFTTGISNAEMIWQTNGNALSFNNIGYNAAIDSFSLEYDAIDNTKSVTRNGLSLEMDNFNFSFSTGALSLAGVSLGELAGDLALSSTAQVFAGGRSSDEGLTIHSQTSILSDPTNYVRFTDDGNSLRMENFNGSLNLTNLTLDIESDHLAIGFDQLDGSFNAGNIFIGDSTKSVGSIELDFLLNDDTVNNRFNRVQLSPGIKQPNYAAMPAEIRSYAESFYSGLDSTSEGLSIATQWNLANADLSYIDDGRRVVISGLKSYGSGNSTIDIRDRKLAIGVSNLVGSYSIDGLRVGSKTAPIQGGAELLLSLEVFQAIDFDIDGYTEITAGGESGGGIRIDGDYFFSNSNLGLSIDENGEGIWATGVNYDIHLRDITIDVASNFTENGRLIPGGVKINRGEQWSTMDIDNLRWGNKLTGTSLGRVKLERFEKSSSLAIIPGGAGAVCVGGSLNGAGNGCSGSGRFEDRGQQGMTVSLKAAFANAGVTSDGGAVLARNRLTWENNRDESSVGSGQYINDSGTQIIFDNYSTNDGTGISDTNDYGFQANLNIDVFETKVLKKTTDAQGNAGDELLYNDNRNPALNEITYVSSAAVEANTPAGEALRARRPLGFAVQGNVSFKEFNIDAVQLKHPDIAAPQTLFYGVVMQNLNLTTNLTATPIQ